MALRENIQRVIKQPNQPEEQWDSPAYHDSRSRIDDSGDMELDVIEQLKLNVFELADLQSRLAFLNDELEKVIGSHRKKF